MPITLQGLSQTITGFQTQGNLLRKAMILAVEKERHDIFAQSQLLVPVDTGALRGSGETPPVTVSGTMIHAEITYGNTAVQYAVPQHERTDFFHTHGEAKYLERPLLAAAEGYARRLGIFLKAAGAL